MKRSLNVLLLILLVTLLTFSFVSCTLPTLPGGTQNGDEEDNGKEDEKNEEEKDEKEPDNLIYNSKSELYFIVGEGVDENQAFNLQSFVDSARGGLSQLAPVDSEPHAHEIVIGNTDRQITKTAKMYMARMTKNNESDLAYYIYSDGSSIAIVFDEDERGVTESMAIEYFKENFPEEELVLPVGEVHKYSFDLIEYYREADNEYRERQWEALYKVLDPSYAEEFIIALRQLYSLYTPDVVTWLANLYEPSICVCYGLYGEEECSGTPYCGTAGFYFSNSGRDTIGYLPDLESTSQGLGVLESWGLSYMFDNKYSRWLPEDMKYKMGMFAQTTQDPDGFFYHPQWGKDFIISNNKDSRRARDLNHAVGLLSLAGLKPLYNTPTGVQGSEDGAVSFELTHPFGKSSVAAVSKVVLTANDNYATHLESVKTFKEYLESYDIRRNSYSVGNRIGSQVGQIQARDRTIGTEENPTPLMDELMKYLIKNQNPETGCWNWNYKEKGIAHEGAELYESVNGLLKIGGDFTSAGIVMPYAEEAAMTALAAVTDPKPLDAVTSLYNTWFAFRNILTNLRTCNKVASYNEATDSLTYSNTFDGNSRADALVTESRGMAIEGIRVSREKISVFKKADGSFSYGPMYSSQTSQGCQVALPNSVEGDVNGTVISIMGIISNTMKALELSKYTPILFGEAERLIYLDIINNAKSVRKNEVVTTGDPITFDYDNVGEPSEELIYSLGTSTVDGNGNPITPGYVTVVENPKGEGNVTQIVSNFGNGDYIKIPNQTNSALAQTFVFEADFLLESTSFTKGSYFTQIRLGMKNYTCYFFTLRLDPNGDIILSEQSSSSWDTSVTKTLGKVGNVGEWFKVKVEYYYSASMDDVRIKVYYDDDLSTAGDPTLLAVTDNFYDASGNKYLIGSATPCKYFEYTEIYMMKDGDTVLYMDNCMTYKVNSPYVQVTDPNNQPAYNVDPPESPEKIYDFEDGSLPEDFDVSAGDAQLTVNGGKLTLNADAANGGAAFAVPINQRIMKSHCALVNMDINCADAKVGSLVRLEGVAGKTKMFGLDLICREDGEGKYLTLREYDNKAEGAILQNVRIALGESHTLTFEYFHREDMIIIYVDGEFVAASSVMYPDGIKYVMDNLSISSHSGAEYSMTVDNVKVEKNPSLFADAVAPTTPSAPHTFDQADESVSISGGASYDGGAVILNSKSSAASVTVPIHTRANLQNIVKFKASFKYNETITRGEAHKILFKDASDEIIFALALVNDGTTVSLCQVCEGGTVLEPIYTYQTKDKFVIDLEIYQENKMVHVIEEGTVKAKTSIFYNSDNVDLKCTKVTVVSSTAKTSMGVDDVILEEYYGAYRKATISSKVQPDESLHTKLDFEKSNSGKLPTTNLQTLLNSPVAAIRVERLINTLMTENKPTGEWSNVIAIDTGKGANDSAIFNASEAMGGYSAVTFEADIRYDAVSEGAAYQIFFSDKSRNNKVYMISMDVKDGQISLAENSSNSYKDGPNINTIATGIGENEWFRLRVEFYKSTSREDVRFKVFINGELMVVSDNFYHSQIESKAPNTLLDCIQFMALSDAVGTLYLDNVSLKGSDATCTDDVTVQNSPNN